jgi:hypothetical protein
MQNYIPSSQHVNAWHANLERALAIGAASTPEQKAAAQAMPSYPLPPNDILFTLSRYNCQLMDENGWAHGQIDRLHAENEALRRELEALRAHNEALRREGHMLTAQNNQLLGENNALLKLIKN